MNNNSNTNEIVPIGFHEFKNSQSNTFKTELTKRLSQHISAAYRVSLNSQNSDIEESFEDAVRLANAQFKIPQCKFKDNRNGKRCTEPVLSDGRKCCTKHSRHEPRVFTDSDDEPLQRLTKSRKRQSNSEIEVPNKKQKTLHVDSSDDDLSEGSLPTEDYDQAEEAPAIAALPLPPAPLPTINKETPAPLPNTSNQLTAEQLVELYQRIQECSQGEFNTWFNQITKHKN